MPARLMRTKAQQHKRGSMRRSRSQPMHPQQTLIAHTSAVIEVSVPPQMASTEASTSMTSSVHLRSSTTSSSRSTTEQCEFSRGNSGQTQTLSSSSAASKTSDSQGNDSSYRSSMHSTSSSVTTNSSFADNNHHKHEPSTPTSSFASSTAVIFAEAAWDNVAIQSDELPFTSGDIIQISDWSRPDLWFGQCNDRHGWFPVSHVRVLAEQPSRGDVVSPQCAALPGPAPKDTDPSTAKQLDEARDSGHSSAEDELESSDGSSGHLQHPTEVDDPQCRLRGRIIDEIFNTEREYLQLISRLVHGFLVPARQRPDLFPGDKLRVIFGNLEQLLELHTRFMMDLENEYNKDEPSSTCIGHCFLRHENSFEIYSDYCNNRPLSCAELARLNGYMQYDKFFQCCRLLFELPALPLEGFLLTPVQRICRYPLQLSELVKATSSTHPDHAPCSQAMAAMRRVANVINDRKRRLESLQKITIWQNSVTSWKGSDLLDHCSRLVHFGDLTVRAYNASGQLQWTKDLVCFLFDHLLVLCKKDLLKRTQLIYKDRIHMQCTTVADLADAKDPILNVSGKNALRVSLHGGTLPLSMCQMQQQQQQQPSSQRLPPVSAHYLLVCRSKKLKLHWANAFGEELAMRQCPKDTPPGPEEKRIALAALRQPYVHLVGSDSGDGKAPPLPLDATPKKVAAALNRSKTNSSTRLTKL